MLLNSNLIEPGLRNETKLYYMKIDFATNLSLRVTGRFDFFTNVSQNFDEFLFLGKLITQGFSCTELESSQ